MRLALVGIGKIALDQHVPSLETSRDWNLTATVSRSGRVEGVPSYASLDAMFEALPEVSAVSLCMPPVPRFEYAMAALRAGRHVMLEKPPGATLAEVQQLDQVAGLAGLTLFASWHSREAAGVEAARSWLSGKTVTRAHINWLEDVRQWHPGQDWVFEPGGMGVFDPGINALSILTQVLPKPVRLQSAVLDVPEGRQTPIAAHLTFNDAITARFDWLKTGPQVWEIEVETDVGTLVLSDGGDTLSLNGDPMELPATQVEGEYPRLYARFAKLIEYGASDVDLTPMTLVADALSLGERRIVQPFEF